MNTPSLDKSNESAREVAKTPWRVDLEKMKQRVVSVEYINPTTLPHGTIALVMLDNGYALQGWSAPADPENFNAERGKEFAYEDAMRKLWPLEAYVMRDLMVGKISMNMDQISERWGQNEGTTVTKTKSSYQDRVTTEAKDLEDKLNKLSEFISKGETFDDLSQDQKNDLLEQEVSMKEYLGVLKRRIARF